MLCVADPEIASGSRHGYDIIDHNQINEIGGPQRFVANSQWCDVLENGPSSPHTRLFDID